MLLNGNGKSLIKKIIIRERIDHMPLEITWNKKIVEIKEERKKIIDWSDKSIKRFRENLKKEGIGSSSFRGTGRN